MKQAPGDDRVEEATKQDASIAFGFHRGTKEMPQLPQDNTSRVELVLAAIPAETEHGLCVGRLGHIQ